jgi:hypothetical protein
MVGWWPTSADVRSRCLYTALGTRQHCRNARRCYVKQLQRGFAGHAGAAELVRCVVVRRWSSAKNAVLDLGLARAGLGSGLRGQRAEGGAKYQHGGANQVKSSKQRHLATTGRLAVAVVMVVVVVVVVVVRSRSAGCRLHRVFRAASDRPHSSTHAHAPHRAMNELRAVLGHTDDDTAPSPKRKKVRRQKYAPKACMSRRPWLHGAFRWFRSSSEPLTCSRRR